MKLVYNKRLGNGDVLHILIEPFGGIASAKTPHSIKVELTEVQVNNSKSIARFFMDNEEEAEKMLIFMLTDEFAHDQLYQLQRLAWQANKLERFFQ